VPPFSLQCQEEQDQRRDQADLNEKVGNREEVGAGDSRHESYQERNDRSGHTRPPFQVPADYGNKKSSYVLIQKKRISVNGNPLMACSSTVLTFFRSESSVQVKPSRNFSKARE